MLLPKSERILEIFMNKTFEIKEYVVRQIIEVINDKI